MYEGGSCFRKNLYRGGKGILSLSTYSYSGTQPPIQYCLINAPRAMSSLLPVNGCVLRKHHRTIDPIVLE
nr:MAG TPA: hypothetical protein [Caudoviricetes sp.]